ncbi:MAG: BF3164 family lipoprotein [Bacteroidales bacterium]|nr:BF3164 family lipoprotein [Bacteroidales bacterium]MDD4671242.1 BF3164 family lipoprotein [Bacteroidales bacterium]
MKVCVIYLTILLFFTSGCINDNNNQAAFKEVVSVGNEVLIESDKLHDPGKICVMGHFLVVCNEKYSPQIEIFDLSSNSLRSSFLNVGNGPNEILHVGSLQYNQLNKELLVADLFKRKIFSYNLDDILKENIVPTILYECAEDSPLMFDKLYKGKNYLIAESRDPRGRILLIDENGKEMGYYLDYPDKKNVDNTLDDILNAKLYSSSLTINSSLDRIALATYGAGMIDICKIEKDRIIPQWNYTEFYPQGIMVVPMGGGSAVAHTDKSRNGFPFLTSSDKYVYALYSGKFLKDRTYPYGDEVYVVSWNGKDTYKIKLDIPINRIAVDTKDEFIYGITSDMDIVRFSIPKR